MSESSFMRREVYFIVVLLVVLIGLTLLVGFNPFGWADGFIMDLSLLGKHHIKS